MNNKLYQRTRTRLTVVVLMLLCAVSKVCAQDYLAGWTLAEGSLPADVSKYYFAIVDVTIYYTERANFVSAGTDVSRLISNGDFEAGGFAFKGDNYEWAKGWQGCGTGASWGGKFVKNDAVKGYFSGNWTEMWGWIPENTLQQSLVGIPNGIYKLEAEILAYDQQESSREHIAKFFAR